MFFYIMSNKSSAYCSWAHQSLRSRKFCTQGQYCLLARSEAQETDTFRSLGNYVIRIGSYRAIDKFIVPHGTGTFRSRTLFLSKNAPFPTLAIKLRLDRSATMRTALGLKPQLVCEEKRKPTLCIMAEFCWTPDSELIREFAAVLRLG